MSRKRLKSIITATPITSSSDSESERETGDVTIENHAQIPDSSKKTPENHSVDGQIEQNELNLEEQKGLKESENLEESESKSNSGNSEPAEAEERQSNDSDQDSTHSVDENDIESDNDMRDNSDENSDRSDSDSEENDNVNQPVQAEIEQLPPEQNDYELFQDIFETPDQEEIEDLMTVKEKKEKQGNKHITLWTLGQPKQLIPVCWVFTKQFTKSKATKKFSSLRIAPARAYDSALKGGDGQAVLTFY